MSHVYRLVLGDGLGHRLDGEAGGLFFAPGISYHIISYYIILCYFVSYYITSGKLAHSSRWETDPYIAKIAHWLKDKEMPSEASPRPALLLSIAITTIIMFN